MLYPASSPRVDGVRQRRSEGEGVVAAQVDRGIALDESLVERGEGDGQLDGGAWFGAAGEGELLVDHG